LSISDQLLPSPGETLSASATTVVIADTVAVVIAVAAVAKVAVAYAAAKAAVAYAEHNTNRQIHNKESK
jgi:hypothetical protein